MKDNENLIKFGQEIYSKHSQVKRYTFTIKMNIIFN